MRLMMIKTDRVISAEEFLEFADLRLDSLDEGMIAVAAEHLQALANNKNFLLDKVNDGLLQLGARSALSASAATMILGRCRTKGWFIRANLWPPVPHTDNPTERGVFSYEGVHDHNFSFLTANYLGPGYETEVWLNRGACPEGHEVGDQVQLAYQGRFVLAPFTQMYYQHGTDVHLQLSPSELSVSLNLMFNDPEVRLRPQHSFDVMRSCVTDRPSGTMAMRRARLIEMAAGIGDFNTLEILEWLVTGTPCRTTREAGSAARLALLKKLNA